MIKRKPSEPFDMVLSFDPVFLHADDEAMRQYLLDRDLSHFDINTDRGIYIPTGELVTVIRAYPLKSESFHLIESGSYAYKQIFKTHVVRVVNLDGVKVRINKDGNTVISDESLDLIPSDVLKEVATQIIERGQGKDGIDRPFSLEATSQLERLRSRSLPANRVRLKSAKDIKSPTNSEVGEGTDSS